MHTRWFSSWNYHGADGLRLHATRRLSRANPTSAYLVARNPQTTSKRFLFPFHPFFRETSIFPDTEAHESEKKSFFPFSSLPNETPLRFLCERCFFPFSLAVYTINDTIPVFLFTLCRAFNWEGTILIAMGSLMVDYGDIIF